MKKFLWLLFCIFLLGAPLTVKILEKTWSKPIDVYESDKETKRPLGRTEKIFIYSYATIFGPLGLLIALMGR